MAEPTKVLVTGGAGFIGSHLVTGLLENSYAVAIVDNLSSGHLRDVNHQATFYHAEINDPKIDQIIQRERPEIVFHLAAQSSVRESSINPVADADSNIVGTVRLISACAAAGVEKIVFSSTGGAIYGNPESIPCDESTPVKPLTPYGLSKRVGELYLEHFKQDYGLDYTILRYANVYGPGQNPHGEAGVVAIFTGMMLEGKCPTIYGTGEQERDFVYVSDVVEANLASVNNGDGRTYNIGTGVGVTVNRIYDLLREYTGFPEEPHHQPLRHGEVFRIALDATLASQELRWEPTVSLEDGLQRTVEYVRSALTRRPTRVRLTPDPRRP